MKKHLRFLTMVDAARLAAVVACAAIIFASGCGSTAPTASHEEATTTKPAEPAVPDEMKDAAKALLGSDAQILLFGDLARTGQQEFLAANVVPKTPTNNAPGTIITRAIVAEKIDGKWSELVRCDEHLKNSKGYLGNTPFDPINGWRLQYEQSDEKGLQLYFTPLKVAGDTHVLPIGVRWNPAAKRYQSQDPSYQHFLKESPTLETPRSALR